MTTRVPQRLPLDPLREIARIWEELIPLPFLKRRVGLDALIGLVPGVGDVAGALVAGWGVVVAVRLGAPASVLARMALNITIDTLIGAIPLLGDLFDIGWKAQGRNIALLERWMAEPDRVRRGSTAILAGLGVAMIATVIGTIWLAVQAIAFFLSLGPNP
jgi:hypothetical protein